MFHNEMAHYNFKIEIYDYVIFFTLNQVKSSVFDKRMTLFLLKQDNYKHGCIFHGILHYITNCNTLVFKINC